MTCGFDPLDLVLATFVVASLGANGLLYARLKKADAPPERPRPAGASGQAWRLPLPGGPPRPVALERCEVRADHLEAQLADLARLRARHTPAAQRWKGAPANEALTALVTPEVLKYATKGGAGARVECRGAICRVSTEDPKARWLMRFRGSEWRTRHLRERGADETGILLEKRDPGAIDGGALLQTALHDFESSGAVEKCQAQFRAEGTLDTHLSIGTEETAPDEAAAIAVSTAGALAGTPLGKCIDEELRRALAQLTIPPRAESAVVMAQFPK